MSVHSASTGIQSVIAGADKSVGAMVATYDAVVKLVACAIRVAARNTLSGSASRASAIAPSGRKKKQALDGAAKESRAAATSSVDEVLHGRPLFCP